MGNGLTMDEGITVTIDDNRITPNLLSNTIDIQPGTSTNIRLTVKEMHRMAAPYTSQCISKYPDEAWLDGVKMAVENDLNSSGTFQLPKYSLNRCISLCYLIRFSKQCGCIWPWFVQSISNFKLFGLFKFCKMSSSSSSMCFWNFLQNFTLKAMSDCQQNCKAECDTKVYAVGEVITNIYPE